MIISLQKWSWLFSARSQNIFDQRRDYFSSYTKGLQLEDNKK